MTNQEFKLALNKRRDELGISYREIQRRTELGYNTVRRVFRDPMDCRIGSVLKVVRALDGDLIFTIQSHIGDELEPDTPVEPFTQREDDGKT